MKLLRIVVPLLEALALLSYGLLLFFADRWHTPLAAHFRAINAEVAAPLVGFLLCVCGAYALVIGIIAYIHESPATYFSWSWPCFVVALAAFWAVVTQHLLCGLFGNALFWWTTATISAILTFFLWLARGLTAGEIINASARAPYNAEKQGETERTALPAAGNIETSRQDSDKEQAAPKRIQDPLLAEKAKYAWNWFQYHADQRLKAFNFYLVLVGIIAVGYSTALKEGLTALKDAPATPTPWFVVASVLGVVGLVISWGFFSIEIRNKELVDAGGHWLDELEERDFRMSMRKDSNTGKPGKNSNTGDPRPFLLRSMDWWCAGGAPGWPSWYSHTLWLRAIYLLIGLSFAFAIAYAYSLTTSSLPR
jgi:hypothetical protein